MWEEGTAKLNLYAWRRPKKCPRLSVIAKGGKGGPIHSSTLAWKSHGHRSLASYSPWGRKELDTTDRLHFLTPSCTMPAWDSGLTRAAEVALSPSPQHHDNKHQVNITADIAWRVTMSRLSREQQSEDWTPISWTPRQPWCRQCEKPFGK